MGSRLGLQRMRILYRNMQSTIKLKKESMYGMPILTSRNMLFQKHSNSTTTQSEFIPLLTG